MNFAEYLRQLVNRMGSGDQLAHQEFADLLGPVFREYFVSKGMTSKHAEALAVSCLYKMAQSWSRATDPIPVWIGQALESVSADVLGDLRSAADIQRRLQMLPDVTSQGFNMAGARRAAKVISGDLHALHVLNDGILAAVGDASGKGPAAGLFAAVLLGVLKSSLFGVVDRASLHPERLLSSLNDVLLDGKPLSEYATLTLGLFDPINHLVTFATAGGPRPLLYQQGSWQEVQISGRPLGILANQTECYESLTLPFGRGDLAILLTDGIADQEDVNECEYGNERLLSLLQRRNDWTADSVIQSVLTSLDQFATGVPQTDDQTLLVLQFE